MGLIVMLDGLHGRLPSSSSESNRFFLCVVISCCSLSTITIAHKVAGHLYRTILEKFISFIYTTFSNALLPFACKAHKCTCIDGADCSSTAQQLRVRSRAL